MSKPTPPTNPVAEAFISAISDLVGAKAEETVSKFWEKTKPGLIHEGSRIVLPADPTKMSIPDAMKALERFDKEEKQPLKVSEIIDAYPLDAAVAFLTAIQNKYGWASPVPTPGFFGPEPPQFVTVRVGPEPGDTLQVPMGSFLVPGIQNRIETRIHMHEFPNGKQRPVFLVLGTVKKAERAVVMELVEEARRILATNSIYRGRALRMVVDEDGDLASDWQGPDFLRTAHVKPWELILADDVREAINVALFTPIQHTAECAKFGVPLKRSVLLSGTYGTGKSMTAAVVSKMCVDNGWTFIMLDKVQGLRSALEFAQRYQPAVVFAEDIDRVTAERDEATNDLLNVVDGILTKDSQVITVLTTNHIEKIHRAMMRPGRLDAVITVTPPDADAVKRLVRMYGRGLVADDITLDRVGEELAGQIPATVREVVERAKLAMISRGGSTVNEDDLLVVTAGMKHHLQMLNAPVAAAVSPEEELGRALARIVQKSVSVDTLTDTAENIAEEVGNMASIAGHLRQTVDKAADPKGMKQLLDGMMVIQTAVEKLSNGTAARKR